MPSLPSPPKVDPQLLRNARERIQHLVNEISELSRSSDAPDHFYPALLQRVLDALRAPAGAVWLVDSPSTIRLGYQLPPGKELFPKDAIKPHAAWLGRVFQSGQLLSVPPGKDNATPNLLLLAPMAGEGKPQAILEVLQRPEIAQATREGNLRFMQHVSGLAGEFLRRQNRQQPKAAPSTSAPETHEQREALDKFFVQVAKAPASADGRIGQSLLPEPTGPAVPENPSRLQDQITLKQKQLQKLQRDKDQLESAVRQQVQALQGERERWKQRWQQMERRQVELEKGATSLQQRRNEIDSLEKDICRELEKREQAVQVRLAEVERLRQRLQAVASQPSNQSQLQQHLIQQGRELALLQADRNQKAQQLEELRQINKAVELQLADVKQNTESAQHSLQQQSDQFELLRTELQQSKTELSHRNQQMAQLQKKLQAVDQQHKQALAELQQRLDARQHEQANSQQQAVNQSAKGLQSSLKLAESRLRKQEEDAAHELHKREETLLRCSKDLQKTRQQLTQATEYNTALRNRLAAVSQEVNQLRITVGKLRRGER